MLVVIDSNIWLSSLALRSSLSAAVLFYISQRGWTVVVPEVVHLEVEANLRTQLTDAVDSVKANHRKLLAVFGTMKEVVLPTQSEIERVVSEVFAIDQIELRHVPFSLESARNSFLRTVEKLPPSHRNQQFKDGVIWADCLALLEEDDVILVTSDKAFFEGDDLKRDLSKELQREAAAKPHTLRLFSELTQLLDDVRVPISVDPSKLLAAFRESEGATFGSLLDRNGFSEGGLLKCSSQLYATSDASRLHLEFQLELEARDITGQDRTGGVLLVTGNGLYAPRQSAFEVLQSGGEELRYISETGEEVKRSIVMGRANIVLGHADVMHSVRHLL
ncbi:PIN domain-containing protein [Comamonas terrigena]|uniref:PIN domain-containing protein n=1 Tax=Comamonas terrigena TaxID=32013 RepID=UPI0024471EC8|nr:PIN domain-containing protein [Comamonas terrigena]MDH1291386.1 PIN domain-containing protein [Comamonas terrigena]